MDDVVDELRIARRLLRVVFDQTLIVFLKLMVFECSLRLCYSFGHPKQKSIHEPRLGTAGLERPFRAGIAKKDIERVFGEVINLRHEFLLNHLGSLSRDSL